MKFMDKYYEKLGIQPNPGRAIDGALLTIVALGFTFAPLAIAFLSTPPGGNMFSEGGNGGGSAIWLMFITIPVGAVLALIGVVRTLIGISRTYGENLPQASDSKQKRSLMQGQLGLALACLLPLLAVVEAVLVFAFRANQNYAPIPMLIIGWTILELLISSLALFRVMQAGKRKWTITVGIFLLVIIALSALASVVIYQLG